mgnify:CR=1 FL=1
MRRRGIGPDVDEKRSDLDPKGFAKFFLFPLDSTGAAGRRKVKSPDVGILQQAVVVILEGFLLKVVSKLVGDDEAIVGVLIPLPESYPAPAAVSSG